MLRLAAELCAPPPVAIARRLQSRQHVAFDASRPSFERRIYSHDPGLERLELVGRYAETRDRLRGAYRVRFSGRHPRPERPADCGRTGGVDPGASYGGASLVFGWRVPPRFAGGAGAAFLLAAGSRAGRTRVGESAFAESGAPSLPRTYPIARHAEQRRWQAAAPPRGLLAARARRVLSVRPTIAGRERPRDLERKPVPSLWMHVFT